MNAPVKDYMTPAPLSIGKDQPLAVAHRLMREHGIRHLPVLSGGSIVGVVSQRDLYFIESLQDVDPASVPVEDAMTADPYVVAPETPLAEVARAMAERKLGSAVVMRGPDVAGVFTTSDALAALVEQLEARPKPRRRSAR
jgi:acetoin utilization protein AcuB